MNSEVRKSFTYRITNANKTQMITILYEMVLTYLGDAEENLDTDNMEEFTVNLKRTQNCIDELIHSLNLNYEIGQNLLSLYLYEKRELITFETRHEKAYLRHAQKTFTELHRAYSFIEKQDKSGPVMTNAQEVYAGLTYNKYNLQVNVGNLMGNRGFKA